MSIKNEFSRVTWATIRPFGGVGPSKVVLSDGTMMDADAYYLSLKVDALSDQIEELRTLVVSLVAAKTKRDQATTESVPVVNFNGPIVAACDRTHVDDVLEDDETYVDLSKKDPKN